MDFDACKRACSEAMDSNPSAVEQINQNLKYCQKTIAKYISDASAGQSQLQTAQGSAANTASQSMGANGAGQAPDGTQATKAAANETETQHIVRYPGGSYSITTTPSQASYYYQGLLLKYGPDCTACAVSPMSK